MTRRKTIPLQIAGRTVVYIYAVLLLIPLYFILVTSVKSGAQITSDPLGLPAPVQFSNFENAIRESGMPRNALNSVIVAAAGVSLALLNAIWVTFCIKKLTGHLIGTIIYSLIIITMFIPGTGMVTMLVLYMRLGLYNNLWGVILGAGFGGTAFNLFLMLGFMRTIPKELEEASFIDGCGDFRSLFYIIVPLMKPVLISIGIFSMVSSWNALMPGLLLLRSPSLYTIPIGLLQFKGTYFTDYSLMFAAVLLAGIPMVVLYLIFQKHFVEALAGSVKG